MNTSQKLKECKECSHGRREEYYYLRHMPGNVRKQRDDLLAETDWVGGTDVPQAIKTTWNTYRQALRDITTQTDPDSITLPIKAFINTNKK